MEKIAILVAIALVLIPLIVAVRVEFGTGDENKICVHENEGQDALWRYTGDAGYDVHWTESEYECFDSELNDGNGQECCPTSPLYTCNRDTQKCVISSIGSCGDITNEADCNAEFESNIAIKSVEDLYGEGLCTRPHWEYDAERGCYIWVTNCRCEWRNDKCEPAYDLEDNCLNTTLITCEVTFLEITECSGGYRNMRWDAFYNAPTTCSGYQDCKNVIFLPTVQCGENEDGDSVCVSDICDDGEKRIRCIYAELDFVAISSIIIAVVLIILFYLILKSRGKRKKATIKKTARKRVRRKRR